MRTAFIGLMICSLLLTGCGSLLPKPAPLPALHDFGLSVARAPASADTFLVTADVTTPAWLDGTGIYYRLTHADATRLRTYADNRWLAPPAELLQARLQTAFGNTAPGADLSGRAYRLRVHLLGLEQVFAEPQSARTQLHVIAELQDLSSGATLAQREFDITQAAAPDVTGAVQGAAQAVDSLVADLLQWVRDNIKTSAVAPAGTPGRR